MNANAIHNAINFGQPAWVEPTTSPPRTVSASAAENQLLAKYQEGDCGAFNGLVKQLHGALIRMALRYVADRDTAEEVVQNTWIAVINGINGFKGQSSLSTWIFAILIHKAKARGVRESRQILFSEFESYDDERDEAVDPSRFYQSGELTGQWAVPPQPWNDQSPEKLLATKQTLQALDKAVNALPAGLRDVLMLCDVEGRESKAICEQLGISENNLYVRLHRARERVRCAMDGVLAECA
jgi:RNA polymerase sigma-70 factor, ECF subfamily